MQSQLVSKTFVFQSQLSNTSENLQISLKQDLQEINISEIIDIFRHKNAMYSPLTFKIYDPEINHYVPLNTLRNLPRSYMYSPVIMIQYRESLPHLDYDKDSMVSSKASSDTKRERNRERTVREVLQYVKQWRQIHNTLDRHKNKINLQDAAKMVGISKKSLDDYFCQLRLAEQYKFDFQSNMEEKIGVLRTFVKKNRPRGEFGIKHERLPKKLKIIEDMIVESYNNGERNEEDQQETGKMQIQQQMQKQKEPYRQQPIQHQTIMESQYQPPMASIPQDQYENRFFMSFNFTLNDYDDPFLSFGRHEPNRNLEIEPQSFLFRD